MLLVSYKTWFYVILVGNKRKVFPSFNAEARVMLPFQTINLQNGRKMYDPWNKSCIQMEWRSRQNEAKDSRSNRLYTTHYHYFLHLDHLNHQFPVYTSLIIISWTLASACCSISMKSRCEGIYILYNIVYTSTHTFTGGKKEHVRSQQIMDSCKHVYDRVKPTLVFIRLFYFGSCIQLRCR
jgi:hypothetical protein